MDIRFGTARRLSDLPIRSKASAGNEGEQPTPAPVVATVGVDTDPLPVYPPARRAAPWAMVSGPPRGTRGGPMRLALVPAHVSPTVTRC